MASELRKTPEHDDTTPEEEQLESEDLYGIWKDFFPEDVDIDSILREIRHEWEREWPEVFETERDKRSR